MIMIEQDKLLAKIIKKTEKLTEQNPYNEILKTIKETINQNNKREMYFVCLYYGILEEANTLEQIGETREPKLTRERVRQIIASGTSKLLLKNDNFFKIGEATFKKELGDNNYISCEDLYRREPFKGFLKNQKGLTSYLNDCGIRQVAYRKKIYFYPNTITREAAIKEIQQKNKQSRRAETVANMVKKAKTVTYVPKEVKDFLHIEAKHKKINLNNLYENIMIEFMDASPYIHEEYKFSKTKSWKARKGKAEWNQIGIYMNKEVFNKIKSTLKTMLAQNKNVSLMGFICQGFVWKFENK